MRTNVFNGRGFCGKPCWFRSEDVNRLTNYSFLSVALCDVSYPEPGVKQIPPRT